MRVKCTQQSCLQVADINKLGNMTNKGMMDRTPRGINFFSAQHSLSHMGVNALPFTVKVLLDFFW